MALNISKGNMYSFVTHTWNTIKGKCTHGCSYCYMKRWGQQSKLYFDEKELKTDLGKNNFIFVGSSNDMFAGDIINDWVHETISHCKKFDNKYLFQTKCPSSYKFFNFPKDTILTTTLETNRYYKKLYNEDTPPPEYRANSLGIASQRYRTMVTIEPILDFDLDELIDLVKQTNAIQVNIGANTSNIKLPEPSKEKILLLIESLKKFTTIDQKRNLSRLLK